MTGPEALVPLGFFAMVTAIAVGRPLVSAMVKRWERQDQRAVPHDVSSRLERMEQAIDSIALEVERIAEGQRFTTKLLSERTGAADAPNKALPERGAR